MTYAVCPNCDARADVFVRSGLELVCRPCAAFAAAVDFLSAAGLDPEEVS